MSLGADRLRWIGAFLLSLLVHLAVLLLVVRLGLTRSALVAAESALLVFSLVCFSLRLGRRGALVSGALAGWLLLLLGFALVGWAVEHPYSRASTPEVLLQIISDLPNWSVLQVAQSAALVLGPCLLAWSIFAVLKPVDEGVRRVA
jgi:hypothetical protein